MSKVLLENGYGIELAEDDNLVGMSGREYRKIRTTRMTIDEEAVARQVGLDLVWADTRAGLPTAEALHHARTGTLNPESVRTLAALRRSLT